MEIKLLKKNIIEELFVVYSNAFLKKIFTHLVLCIYRVLWINVVNTKTEVIDLRKF